jgi:murein DD-endopeptidase MepM/ murein hydrolase activator NlpD
MASLLRRYKKAEFDFLKKLIATLKGIGKAIVRPVGRFFRHGREQVTVLVVFHSEKPPMGHKFSHFAMGLIVLLLFALPAFAVYSFASESRLETSVRYSNDKYEGVHSELSSCIESTNSLLKAYKAFSPALSASVAILPTEGKGAKSPQSRSFLDPFALFAKQPEKAAAIEEVCQGLDKAAEPLEVLGKTISAMSEVKIQVPAVWPIKGDAGHLSMSFGLNPNPFTGQTYFHDGIDCSTYRQGDPIQATADGRVTLAGYSGGYGLCVIIAHANGYYTRYGHMEKLLVSRGQMVKQGQTIGLLGATGNVTGPHVHYEVILDGKLVDPLEYLWTDHKGLRSSSGEFNGD